MPAEKMSTNSVFFNNYYGPQRIRETTQIITFFQILKKNRL